MSEETPVKKPRAPRKTAPKKVAEPAAEVVPSGPFCDGHKTVPAVFTTTSGGRTLPQNYCEKCLPIRLRSEYLSGK